LLPAKLPQCPVSQFKSLTTFLGGSSRIVEQVIFHLPCHRGASLELLGEMIPPGDNEQFDSEKVFILSESQDEGLKYTMEPSEVQEPVWGVLPIRLVRTWV
jgi:hypothetical protein